MWGKKNQEEKVLERIYERFRNYSMIPKETFTGNLKLFSEFRNVGGDFVECGVWKGGMSAAASALLNDKRNFFLFDSFLYFIWVFNNKTRSE